MRTPVSGGVSHQAMAALAASLAAVFIVGCTPMSPPQSSPSPSDIRREVVEGLRYTLAVPPGHDAHEPVPLVVALHPGGERPPFYGGLFLTMLVEPALRELGAIMVGPDCTGRDWTDPESEKDLLTVLQHLEENFNLDPGRTLITGFSMGGIGTWHLGERHQDRFRAALILAAHPTPGAAEAAWEIPLYVIHSRADEILPIRDTDAVVSRLRSRGIQVEYVALNGLTHFETIRYVGPLHDALPWIRRAWGWTR